MYCIGTAFGVFEDLLPASAASIEPVEYCMAYLFRVLMDALPPVPRERSTWFEKLCEILKHFRRVQRLMQSGLGLVSNCLCIPCRICEIELAQPMTYQLYTSVIPFLLGVLLLLLPGVP